MTEILKSLPLSNLILELLISAYIWPVICPDGKTHQAEMYEESDEQTSKTRKEESNCSHMKMSLC